MSIDKITTYEFSDINKHIPGSEGKTKYIGKLWQVIDYK